MGYRGKIDEQNRARDLRAQAWTLQDIAAELGVAKSSVSTWVRDVEFEPQPRRSGRRRSPNALQRAKQAQIDDLLAEGRARIGTLTDHEFLVAGTALYAGEGAKRPGEVAFTNSDPRMVAFFCKWLRRFFDIDEERVRVRLYLHADLDLGEATRFWSSVTEVPVEQFRKAYRPAADPSIRTAKHLHGCASVCYTCTRTHRAVMGLVSALLMSRSDLPG